MLRPATPDDIPLIRTLADRIWWAHYPALIGTGQVAYMLAQMYSAEALERQMRDEGQQFWIVQPGPQPLGYLAVSGRGPGSYFLNKFYLDTTQQRQGIGGQAFRALLEQYPDLRELRLTVNRRNIKSINFYFKIGFSIETCVDIPIGEGFVMDDFQMLWKKPAAG